MILALNAILIGDGDMYGHDVSFESKHGILHTSYGQGSTTESNCLADLLFCAVFNFLF